MDLHLAGKTALVFGAGGGLGGAIARSLLAEGAFVVACDLVAESLESLKEEADDAVDTRAFDMSDLVALEAHLKEVLDSRRAVDVLVNNTGGPPPGPLSGVDTDTWQKFFASMVLPVIYTTQTLLPRMQEKGWGRVITSTSSGVVAPIDNLGVSNALRSTLVGWSKTLANEVAKTGVTSNIILPGRIATKRILSLDEARAEREGKELQEVIDNSHAAIPVGRYGKPSEYGDVVAFLASEQASFINGSVIRVDGGMIPSI